MITPPNNPRPTIPSAPATPLGKQPVLTVLPPSGFRDLSPEELEGLLAKITDRFQRSYDGVHARWRQRAEKMYGLYRNWTEFRNQVPVDRRDRDVMGEAQSTWGTELFIPYAFSTVETILPRMMANLPSILVNPRNRASEANVENVKWTIQAQQEQIDYELTLQKIARTALITGLGPQKTYWLNREGKQLVRVPGIPTEGNPSGWVIEPQGKVFHDDPMLEYVDPWEFIYDPMADSMRNCGWVVHRTWRDIDYCKRMLEQGKWTGVTAEDVTRGPNGGAKFSESAQKRQAIAGYPNMRPDPSIQEIWEYHDGDQVVTVLNRQWIVQRGANPAWHGEIPFQVYRPTEIAGQMAGIGEIEPIEDLQAEINELRSQRRDNAKVILQKSFFYADGMIDPGDFKIGPGRGVPVLGDPREAVFPIQFGEIPNSGYQEERQLQADIERTTGIDDTLSGAGGPQQTATGVQLVQAAANERIKRKARNCEVEMVRNGGRQMLALTQQKRRTNRDVRIPAVPEPGQPDRRWSWLSIGPAELAGEFEIDIEAGSMAPENVPQMRQDAQMMIALKQSEFGGMIDDKLALDFILRNSGIKNPDAWKKPQEGVVPAGMVDQAFKALEESGVSRQLIEQVKAAIGGQGAA